MKTLKEELQDCLAEMKACQAETEKLLNNPRIKWPTLEDDIRIGDICEVIGNRGNGTEHHYKIRTLVKVLDIGRISALCDDIFGIEQFVNVVDLKKVI